jgi:SAM-dependent methyltransferase
VHRFLWRGGLLVLVAVVMAITNQGFGNALIAITFAIGVGFLLTSVIMIWSSRFGKLKTRDRILNQLPWRGDEQVLDIGCGRGLFLIGAAKRLTSGKATGVDIWRDDDLSNNSSEATLVNAKAEGVAAKVKVEEANAVSLPFKDSTFDTVLSSLALHNIEEKDDRAKALREIVRVLKPGGYLAILDIFHTGAYAKELEQLGVADLKLSGLSLLWCLPTRYLTARKP